MVDLLLTTLQAPGDVLCMTAAVRSLHAAHPGKFRVAVGTLCDSLFDHNPDIVPAHTLQSPRVVEMHYPLIDQSNDRLVHVLQGYCDYLAGKLAIPVPLAVNRPVLHLSRAERESIMDGKYWLISCGHKSDFTTKFWGLANYQAVVDHFAGRVLFVQVGAAEHDHPRLRGVRDMVGSTTIRELIRLAAHSQGGVGGVTLLMHIMAALRKPYICIAGGREPVTWNTYPTQHLLHVGTSLDCCSRGGCWKSRVVPLGDGSEKDASLCARPVSHQGETIPECMRIITPGMVASFVEMHCVEGR